jgi:flagellar hook-associated protein 2
VNPIASFSGLASGIQWRDMVDQIMRLEEQRQLAPLQRQVRLQESRVSAWGSYKSVVSNLAAAMKKLQDGAAFGAYSAAVGTSPTTSHTLLSASASSSAAPGSYKVEVAELARAEKLSGGVFSDSAADLALAGEFVINGRRVEIVSGDSLNTVRDKINAANSGTSPSGVTATVLSTSSGSHRLVLTSDHTGSAGIDLSDSSNGVLKSLGFLDGTTSANLATDGRSQTHRLSSTTAAIATALGVSVYPPPSTIAVGGKSITVDLSVDSLAAIVTKIESAGGTAETVSETVNGTTQYRLKADGAVSASDADGERVLELLGFKQGGRSAVKQVVESGSALSDTTGATATTATALTDLSGGVTVGDTFTIKGTRGDGSAVNLAYTVGAGDTIQSVLDRLNDTTDGFGAGSRAATVSFAGGKFQVADSQAGDSQLSFSIVANNEGGGSLHFGTSRTATVGRLREMTGGSDAKVRIDGVLLTRQSNTVSDAISGVTLNLLQAEAGTEVDLSITRDQESTTKDVQAFIDAYNKVRSFVDGQNAGTGKPLDGSSTLRTSMRSFTDVILTEVGSSTPTIFTRLTLVGISLTQTGNLELNASAFKDALAANPDDVKALFADVGARMSAATDLVTRTGDGLVESQSTSLGNSVTRLNERIWKTEGRLDLQREGLIKQFTAMEQALSRIQAQGNWLMGQLAALQPMQR